MSTSRVRLGDVGGAPGLEELAAAAEGAGAEAEHRHLEAGRPSWRYSMAMILRMTPRRVGACASARGERERIEDWDWGLFEAELMRPGSARCQGARPDSRSGAGFPGDMKRPPGGAAFRSKAVLSLRRHGRVLARPPIAGEAETSEAEKHHRPGRRLGDGHCDSPGDILVCGNRIRIDIEDWRCKGEPIVSRCRARKGAVAPEVDGIAVGEREGEPIDVEDAAGEGVVQADDPRSARVVVIVVRERVAWLCRRGRRNAVRNRNVAEVGSGDEVRQRDDRVDRDEARNTLIEDAKSGVRYYAADSDNRILAPSDDVIG